jgi:hypothetical protein
MHSINHPNEELTVSFSLAYDAALRPHHSFIVRPIFNASSTIAISKMECVLTFGTLVGYECVSLEKGFL